MDDTLQRVLYEYEKDTCEKYMKKTINIIEVLFDQKQATTKQHIKNPTK